MEKSRRCRIIMKKLFLSAIAIFIGLTLYSQQQKVNPISIIGKTNTTYQFTITGKNLDEELSKLKTNLGKPLTESEGEIIWNNINIPNIGDDLQLKMVDGLLTTKGNTAKFKPFKYTKNKNKSKYRVPKIGETCFEVRDWTILSSAIRGKEGYRQRVV